MNRLLPYLKYWKPATFAALVLLTWASISYGKHQAYERGLSDAKNAQLVQAFKTFSKQADFLAKKVQHQDTVITERVKTFTQTRVAYKTVVDTVQVLAVDSAALLAVEHAADSQQAASDSVSASKDVKIGLLEAGISTRDSMLVNLHAQLKIALDNKPGFLSKVGGYAVKGLALYGGVSAVKEVLKR